jgi:hypothetical protein
VDPPDISVVLVMPSFKLIIGDLMPFFKITIKPAKKASISIIKTMDIALNIIYLGIILYLAYIYPNRNLPKNKTQL